MEKWKITIHHEVEIEGVFDGKEEVMEKWWDNLARENQTAETFITDFMEVKKVEGVHRG